jgi:hypothetical protein
MGAQLGGQLVTRLLRVPAETANLNSLELRVGANLSAAKRAGSANSHICPYFQILRYVQGVFEVMYRSEVFIGHPPPPPAPRAPTAPTSPHPYAMPANCFAEESAPQTASSASPVIHGGAPPPLPLHGINGTEWGGVGLLVTSGGARGQHGPPQLPRRAAALAPRRAPDQG